MCLLKPTVNISANPVVCTSHCQFSIDLKFQLTFYVIGVVSYTPVWTFHEIWNFCDPAVISWGQMGQTEDGKPHSWISISDSFTY